MRWWPIRSATPSSVLLGNSDGSLQNAVSYSTGYAQAVAAGDFNGDGRVDLAVVNSNNNSTVTVLLGNNTKPLTEDPAGSGSVDGAGDGEHPDDLGRGLVELHGVGGGRGVGERGPLPGQQSAAVCVLW